jgi:hypothetical protein
VHAPAPRRAPPGPPCPAPAPAHPASPVQADIRDLQHPGASSLGDIFKGGLGLGRLRLGAAIGALGAAAGSALGAAAAGAAAAGGGGGGGAAAGGGATGPGGRPRAPHEFPAVIVFVVGGLSVPEWRAVRQELEHPTYGHKPAVLVGGTALLAPGDAVRQLLGA